ncbi:nucleoside-diphosphate-sugar epimerase [Natronocella acetinitrilica]|uniref:Nucleoside-diphosphate-sugar epimerase n=1 Tax=Natronocella acetinitrilica TaxID=414046 RepID=A0AAE3KEA4_9GAMM|nr:D-erythronate dehydrogenase [Natronocella acetinitrilica]MCP1677268.1 nucleoside-diphosphate-sugar epimerase [Natronocella acetinitrilica]
MRIIITGGAGFIGQKLAAAIARAGTLPGPDGGEAVRELVLFDQVEATPPPEARVAIHTVAGDIADTAALDALFAGGADVVYHLASVVSAAAESDFELGMGVNFDGTRAVLEASRKAGGGATRFIFTSSVAVFGGDLPPVVEDHTAPMPQNSYGIQKAMAELLVSDYSRRGFVDGRALRLPTIAVRPGRPNKAASTFASSIIREPLQGEEAVLPVPEELAMFVLSPRQAIQALVHAAGIPAADFGGSRSVMLPGIRVTVGEMISALRRVGGDAAVARIRREPDPTIEAIVGGWPADFDTAKAERLGFQRDEGIDAIVEAFIEDDSLPAARAAFVQH